MEGNFQCYYFLRTEELLFINIRFTGELLLLLPHSENFDVKMNPCGNHLWKYIFLENLEGKYFHHQFKILLFFARKMN